MSTCSGDNAERNLFDASCLPRKTYALTASTNRAAHTQVLKRYREVQDCSAPLLAASHPCTLREHIQIYFQAGILQMKSRSPKFAQIPKIRQVTAKKCNRKWKFVTGNRI